jgi:flagellar FliL protein
MAEKELDLPEERSGSSKKLILIMLIVMVLSIGGTAVVMSLLMSASSETAEVIEVETQEEPKEHLPPLFVSVDKLLVNFRGEGRAQLLAADASLLTYDEKVKTALEASLPTIRSELNFLLREQNFSDLETLEGSEKIRALALERINQTLQERLGDDQAKIEGVYFTRFVTQ